MSKLREKMGRFIPSAIVRKLARTPLGLTYAIWARRHEIARNTSVSYTSGTVCTIATVLLSFASISSQYAVGPIARPTSPSGMKTADTTRPSHITKNATTTFWLRLYTARRRKKKSNAVGTAENGQNALTILSVSAQWPIWAACVRAVSYPCPDREANTARLTGEYCRAQQVCQDTQSECRNKRR